MTVGSQRLTIIAMAAINVDDLLTLRRGQRRPAVSVRVHEGQLRSRYSTEKPTPPRPADHVSP
jgi:phenylalanyl-tRNA synthetase beta subunit